MNFCKKHGVEFFVRYDLATDSFIIRVKKRKYGSKDERWFENEVSISGSNVIDRGFGLTFRIILRNMADELDKLCEEVERRHD